MYPLGFTTLADYLERYGFEVRIINLAVRMLRSQSFKPESVIEKLDPLMFGIDLHWLPHAHGAIELAKLVKKYHPKTPIVFGGYSSTYFVEELMQYPEVDFVLKGDSTEEPLVELLAAVKTGGKTFSSIPNLSWKDTTGAIHHNPISYVPENINHINLDYRYNIRSVFRYRDLIGCIPFNGWLKYPITAALTCRGCYNGCVTCGASAAAFRKVLNRRRPAFRDPELLARDIIRIQEVIKGPIFILGDIRQPGDDYASAFLEKIRKKKIRNQIGIEFFTPPPKEFFEKLAYSLTHFSIEISLESHNEEIRRNFGKRFSNEEVERAISFALKYGAERVDIYFMTGLPGQDYDSILETIDYCRYLYERFNGDKRLLVFISPMAPFLDPGSKAFENPERYGYKLFYRTLSEHRRALLAPSWKYTLNYETKWLSRSEQVEAIYLAAYGLNKLKAQFGIITERTANKVARRIHQAKRVIEEIDRVVLGNGEKDWTVFNNLESKPSILNVSTVCDKRELHWPTGFLNFRPIGVLKVIWRMTKSYMKSPFRSPEIVKGMFGKLAERYDLANHLLTLCLDKKWRRIAAESTQADKNSVVLDACTGTGDLAFEVHRLKGARVVAVDFSSEMLFEARRKAARLGVNGAVAFRAASVDNLPFDYNAFDAITIGFGLRNTKDYLAVLKEFYRVAKKGGRLVCLEFSHPKLNLIRKPYEKYLAIVVPFIGKLVAKDQSAYRYLANSIKAFPSQEELAQLIEAAGWTEVQYKNLLGGIVAIHTAVKK
jgi:B12-binding domain/radical SAM domain protein